jgi:hypothetical protein
MAYIIKFLLQLIIFIIADVFSLIFLFRFYKIGRYKYYYCCERNHYKVENLGCYNSYNNVGFYINKYQALFQINKQYVIKPTNP